MSRALRIAQVRAVSIALVAMMLALASPMSAVAETGSFTSLGASLLVRSQAGESLLLVSGVLPDTTPLPAEVALPVPEGSEVRWAGEIVGETIEEDIQRDAVIEDRDGVTVAVFTLTESRVAQVEVVYPGATQAGAEGVSEASFSIVAPAPAGSARLAIALPTGGEATALPEGMLASPGPEGYTYYYTDTSEVSVGDPLELSLAYTITAMPQPVPGTPAPASEVPPLLVALLAAVFAGSVLMFLASRARTRGASADAATAENAAAAYGADFDEADDSYVPETVDESVAFSDDGSATDSAAIEPTGASAAAPATGSFLTPRMLLVAIAVLVLGIVLAVNLAGGSQVGVTSMADGWITQQISTASPVQQVEYTIVIACSCPPEEEAPKIFDALRTLPGVASGSLERDTLVLRIGYDPSLTDEAAIRGVLQSRGYLQ